MPWWFWVLLWAVLLLGSLASAAVAGYWLFRRGMALMRDAGEAFAGIGSGAPWEATGDADDGGGSADVDPSRRAGGMPTAAEAVFADPDALARAYSEGKAERRNARRLRRIERRALRGQPQSLRDVGLI
jgi:hypothetical protein